MTTSVADTSTVSGSVKPAVPSGLSTASGSLRMLLTNLVSSQLVSGPPSSSSMGALKTSTSERESARNASVPQFGRQNMTPVIAICSCYATNKNQFFLVSLEECCNSCPVYDGGVSSTSVSPRVTQATPEAENVCGNVAVKLPFVISVSCHGQAQSLDCASVTAPVTGATTTLQYRMYHCTECGVA